MASGMMLPYEKILQWSFKEKGSATIRFTEVFSTDGQWKKIGEITMNGTNWYPLFEMNLRKHEPLIKLE